MFQFQDIRFTKKNNYYVLQHTLMFAMNQVIFLGKEDWLLRALP